MSAAAAANGPITSLTPPPSSPSAVELEDLLYDIVAGGGDPSLSHETQQAVQSFLHEHARQRKTHPEFLAFFEKHALSMQPERAALIALPPLEARGRAAETPPLQLVPQASDPPLSSEASRGSKQVWAWPIVLAAVAGLAYLGYEIVEDLRGELTSVRAQAADNVVELTRVRAEAEQLRVTLREQTQRIERADQKSELLLQTLASPLDPKLR